eukprot:TRINITY_DN5789_c0_g2_i2.p1 TRINITY_DN5789_c0_g2~~TRINITY_DN5789_c0_g2_i2.p1  ORF type:complete len:140 (+),score=17.03 TRINITY_DN5789_c0_g2_i2:642-1061(+)
MGSTKKQKTRTKSSTNAVNDTQQSSTSTLASPVEISSPSPCKSRRVYSFHNPDRFVSAINGIVLHYSSTTTLPKFFLQHLSTGEPVKQSLSQATPQTCVVNGCKNMKRYSHSLLKLPICSLECYKILTCHLQTSGNDEK